MKVHNNLKELLADFSIYHHGWLLDKDDNRTFTELTDDYLSANSLALGKPEPLAKNKQGENNCILERCDETRQADSDICTKHLRERGNAIM